MATSHFMVKLEIDADRAGIEFPVFARDGDFDATVEIDGRRRMLIPDATIVLVSRGDPQLFFLEMDMSTETLKWIALKIRKYLSFHELHPTVPMEHAQRTYQCRGFRVLIICKSKERLANLVALAAKTKKKRMFHFLTLDQVIEQGTGGPQAYTDASLLTERGFTTPKSIATLYPASEHETGSQI